MPLLIARWLLVAVLVGSSACQRLQATPPLAVAAGSPNAGPTPPPATTAGQHDSLDRTVDAWLNRIEATASTIKTLRAELIYDRLQQLVGDRQRRFGTLVFESGPPGRFAIHFDRTLIDQRLDHDDRRYIFDGRWLTERFDNEKLLIKRQIVPPPGANTEKQPTDPLAIGAGPFIIPINLDKDDLNRRFDVTLIPFEPQDPPETVHLRLIPRNGHASEITELNLWYDRQTTLPVRVGTSDESENESVVQLINIQVNTPVAAKVFDSTPPPGDGWRVEVIPWKTNAGQ